MCPIYFRWEETYTPTTLPRSRSPHNVLHSPTCIQRKCRVEVTSVGLAHARPIRQMRKHCGASLSKLRIAAARSQVPRPSACLVPIARPPPALALSDRESAAPWPPPGSQSLLHRKYFTSGGRRADLRTQDLSLSRSSLLSLSPGDSAALLSRSLSLRRSLALSADDNMVARTYVG